MCLDTLRAHTRFKEVNQIQNSLQLPAWDHVTEDSEPVLLQTLQDVSEAPRWFHINYLIKGNHLENDEIFRILHMYLLW